MVELANLCGYLGLDFNKYFDGYELPKKANSLPVIINRLEDCCERSEQQQ